LAKTTHYRICAASAYILISIDRGRIRVPIVEFAGDETFRGVGSIADVLRVSVAFGHNTVPMDGSVRVEEFKDEVMKDVVFWIHEALPRGIVEEILS
jgi:hypothetical protein